MSINEFDKQFKERFDKHEFAYNPLGWGKLSYELPEERTKRRILPWLTGMAASVALLAGASWFLHHGGNKPATDVVVSDEPKQETAVPVAPNPAQKKLQALPEQSPLQHAAPIPGNMLVQNGQTKKEAIPESLNNTQEPGTVNLPIRTEPYEKNLLSFPPDPVSKLHEAIVTQSDPLPTPAKTITNENLRNPIFFPSETTGKSNERKTSVSLAGGFNYGSFNTGYGASVNARQKIGRKVFIEGDLGFMQNQEVIASSMSTNQFNILTSGQFKGRPAKLEERPYNIYYFQMTPVIGYQIHKNISVGVGADVQKLLDGKKDDRPVVITEEGFRLIPLWDAGITGKTEYTISKRLKAGILYRGGVNNLLQGNDNYYERRYLQVQMKLKLFGK